MNQPKNASVVTNQRGGLMASGLDLAPGQNPYINFESSLHNRLITADPKPNNTPELHGRMTQSGTTTT